MKEQISLFLSKHINLGKDEILALIETPPSPEFGDYAFPCYSLSKIQKKGPQEIAKNLAQSLSPKLPKEFEKLAANGPYLNFFVNKSKLALNTINKILKEKEKFGSGLIKEKVMIEFSQANTHKAFHIGHIRGTSLGESLARIFKFQGSKVIKANYQGDTGMHVAKWLWCYLKYHKKEKIKPDESWFASIYVDAVKRLGEDERLQEQVDEINRRIELKQDKKLSELWQKTRKLCLQSMKVIYKELNTSFDKYYFESEVEKRGKEIAQELAEKGIAKLSDGAVVIDLESHGLSTWVLLRKDGTVLYSAKDLALVEKKFRENKISRNIYVVADEQNLHFKQLFKTLELMKFKNADKCSHISFGLVRLPEGKMSSRTGQNILYSDFKNEILNYARAEIKKRFPNIGEKELEKRALAISISAIKYSMLRQSSSKLIVFSKEDALNFEGDTGPYLLYSYARACSILKKSKNKPNAELKESISSSPEEKEALLIKKLSEFPDVAKHSYKQLAPPNIANYSLELAHIFNEFYHTSQVIGSENEQFRLALVQAFRIILKQSLYLLGIDTIDEM